MKSYNLERLTILVLEKHLLIRNMLTEVFKEFGVATAHSTADPDTAFDIFCRTDPDIVLCDWTPNLDGMGFLYQIRNSAESPNPYVPAVVVTANTELRHVCIARDTGMTEFLAKPVSAKSVYQRICNVIDNPRPFVRIRDFFGPDRRRRGLEFGGQERRKLVANAR